MSAEQDQEGEESKVRGGQVPNVHEENRPAQTFSQAHDIALDIAKRDANALISPVKTLLMTHQNDRFQQRVMKIVNKHILSLEMPVPAEGSPASKRPLAPSVRHDLRTCRISSIDSST